jgi:hypothetical protein
MFPGTSLPAPIAFSAAAHHRPRADAQGTGRLLVGEAGDVDGDEDVAEVVGERGDRGVELARLERRLWLARLRIGDELELLGQRVGTEATALSPLLGQEGVAQRPEEVAEVVLVAEQAWAGEHARVRFLDEVLGLFARAAERPGGAVEPVEVVSEPGGVERAPSPVAVRRSVGVVACGAALPPRGPRASVRRRRSQRRRDQPGPPHAGQAPRAARFRKWRRRRP